MATATEAMTMRYPPVRLPSSTYTTTTIFLLLASVFQLASFARADEPSPRVVGGEDADFSEYPFFTSWGKSCGATLIHDDILLTAAHVSCEMPRFRHCVMRPCILRFPRRSDHLFSLRSRTRPNATPSSRFYSAIRSPRTKSLSERTPKMYQWRIHKYEP